MKDVMRLLSWENFTSNQKEVWDFVNILMQKVMKCSDNPGHKSIANIMKLEGIKSTLVTQNIDGLHTKETTGKEFKKRPGVFEIHGNGYYMRCWN